MSNNNHAILFLDFILLLVFVPIISTSFVQCIYLFVNILILISIFVSKE